MPDSANLLGLINTPTSGKDTPGFMKFRHVFLTPDIAKMNSQISNNDLDTPSLDNPPSIPLLQRVSIDTPTTPTQRNLHLGLDEHFNPDKLSSSVEPDSVERDDKLSKDTNSPCITPTR